VLPVAAQHFGDDEHHEMVGTRASIGKRERRAGDGVCGLAERRSQLSVPGNATTEAGHAACFASAAFVTGNAFIVGKPRRSPPRKGCARLLRPCTSHGAHGAGECGARGNRAARSARSKAAGAERVFGEQLRSVAKRMKLAELQAVRRHGRDLRRRPDGALCRQGP
jgi:hypothetical protein